MPTKTGKTPRLHPQAITAGTDFDKRKNDKWKSKARYIVSLSILGKKQEIEQLSLF